MNHDIQQDVTWKKMDFIPLNSGKTTQKHPSLNLPYLTMGSITKFSLCTEYYNLLNSVGQEIYLAISGF